jgi:hypothetical protein
MAIMAKIMASISAIINVNGVEMANVQLSIVKGS